MTTNISRNENNREAFVNNIITYLKKQAPNFIPPVIAIISFLIIWQLFTLSPESTLPGPIKVIQDSYTRIFWPFAYPDREGTAKGLAWQILASLRRVAIGYGLAGIVGIILGIIVGVNSLLFRALDPIFQLLRTIPPLAWLPIALAAFQQSEPSAIYVIFITALWPILINTIVGVQQIPQDYKNVARVLRLSQQKYFIKIVLPAAVPYIFTGLRIGIGLAWLAIVAAEMITGGVGIGYFMFDAYNVGRVSDVIVALVYVGIVGLLLDRLMAFISTKVVPGEQK
ncbi:MAG: nitrate ABC transporter permease [Oscillatoriaceae bacterium SKW80]|nr:nitrate ABC transporter permease [Oscillatoriaceae bacterium SKYG93]MCX8120173.1 nitrate ABC transporter permease [Oscillatoriaceae bacterium SKW80]MDW8453099.1 nitrate ABC transporter permease [Oscillatoriaceae cyanobacterium SKYGB_i_bin93]HIK28990.1 nitrate ABC transporter permease [Oscillatoriaceae cyanobacterium M7585_C2015_266]